MQIQQIEQNQQQKPQTSTQTLNAKQPKHTNNQITTKKTTLLSNNQQSTTKYRIQS